MIVFELPSLIEIIYTRDRTFKEGDYVKIWIDGQ